MASSDSCRFRPENWHLAFAALARANRSGAIHSCCALFITDKSGEEKMRYMPQLAHRKRRRRTARCPICKKKFKINSRGRPPIFCSRSCCQRAYEQRKWSRPHPIELLARDIDTARVRDVIRQEVREALLAAGIILPPPAPKPKATQSPSASHQVSVSSHRQAGDSGSIDAVGTSDSDWLHRPQTGRGPRVSEFIQPPEPTGGPTSAAFGRTFNAFPPGYDRRFVVNYRKLMNFVRERQAVTNSELIKVTACGIALCRGVGVFDTLQRSKHSLSNSGAIQRAVGCGFRFNDPANHFQNAIEFLIFSSGPLN
jgi:hypothetical protein